MLRVDCKELSEDEELALASSISDSMEGTAVALIRDGEIVIDVFEADKVSVVLVAGLVKDFVSRRKDSSLYSVESEGDKVVVHSPDPLVGTRRRKPGTLPLTC